MYNVEDRQAATIYQFIDRLMDGGYAEQMIIDAGCRVFLCDRELVIRVLGRVHLGRQSEIDLRRAYAQTNEQRNK